MPIYDYHCDHCGHTFSQVQSYADATLEQCPQCGKRPRKLLTAPAIVFKGGGWYKTDSRVTPKEGGDGAAGPEAKGTADAKAAKDAKPAAEKPAKTEPAKPEAPAPTARKGDAASS